MFVLEADDALSSISAGIDELAGEELRHVDGADLIRTWKERCRLDAEFTRRFAIFEKRYGFTADGALSGAAWLRAHCHMDAGAASDRVFTARKLLSLPETEAAFGAGEINYEHARVIARAVDSCGPEAVLEHEKVLVDVGREEVPQKLRYATEVLQNAVDPTVLCRTPTRSTRDAASGSASSTAWTGSTATSTARAGPPCAPRSKPSWARPRIATRARRPSGGPMPWSSWAGAQWTAAKPGPAAARSRTWRSWSRPKRWPAPKPASWSGRGRCPARPCAAWPATAPFHYWWSARTGRWYWAARSGGCWGLPSDGRSSTAIATAGSPAATVRGPGPTATTQVLNVR